MEEKNVGIAQTLSVQYVTVQVKLTGCKENRFYSLPFGQAEATIY